MTFSNPAYGEGTFVRCDTCRDPYALVQARAGSEVVLPFMGRDAAERKAVSYHGFRRTPDGGLVCAGCAAATAARLLAHELRHTDLCQSVGVGDEKGHPVLIVYATRDPRASDPLPLVREGLPVRVRVVGTVGPT